jgi:uncharacterized repeat protein (TIGR01451 family)
VGVVPGAIVAISPSVLIFGDQSLGTTSAVQSVTVTNIGSANLVITNLAFIGGNGSGDFVVSNNTCLGSSIPTNGTCTINIAFAPSDSGIRFTQLRILSNAGTNNVQISGTGIVPAITLIPDPLDFGSNVVGSVSTRTLTVFNSGNANLLIPPGGVTVGGANPGDFSVTTNGCSGGPILPGQSCFIEVQFRPTAALPRSAQLIITSNASNSPAIATLTGIGVRFSCPTITLAPSTLPTPVRGIPYTNSVSASGGISPYNFLITSGTLPTGLGLSITNGSALIAGTPTASGIFNFTLTAIDSNNCTGSQSYTLTVACPTITVLPLTLPAGTSSAAYSQTLTATGGAPPYTFGVVAGAQPPGLTLFSSGVLSGTPTNNGSFTFTVRATDATGCTGNRSYTIDINCPGLTVLPEQFLDAIVNLPYSQTNTASGGTPPYAFTVLSGTLPTGLTYTNGVLAGTPTAVGPFNFTIRATDANSCTATRAYTLSVICGTLTILPQTLTNATIGTLYNQALSANGGTGTLNFARTSGSLPPGLTLTSSGAVTGTPTLRGSFGFQVLVTDAAHCSGSRNFTLNVGCPVFAVSPTTLPFGDVMIPYSQALTASGGTAPYTITQTGGSLPAGLSLSSTVSDTATISGIPTSGGSVFTLTIKDANGCQANFTYALILSNSCPPITVAPSTLPAGAAGLAYSQTLTGSGGTSPYRFATFGGTLPAGLTLSSAGTLSGTLGAAGSFTFTVAGLDAMGCAGLQTYTLNIACDTITVLPSALATGTVGLAYSQTLTATGGIAPHSFAVTGGTLPGGLVLDNAGTLSGSPTNAGTFAFTVTATDTVSCTGSQLYSLTINPATDLAVSKSVSPNPAIVGSNVTYTIAVTNLGPATATSVRVTDTLPSSVTFVSSSSGCIATGGVFACNLGSLVSGAGATLTIVATTTSEGQITNTVSVSSALFDFNIANNTATTTSDVGAIVIFGAAAQIVSANAGSAVVRVARLGETPDPITVQYTTADNTAVAGVDYTATAGSLTFGPGVTSQTFTVPILPGNKKSKTAKGLKLGLNNISGAKLGNPSTAVMNIVSKPINTFTDVDGDIVTVKLTGSGSMQVSLSANGTGPIDQIELSGTDAQKSSLSITVKRGRHGDGFVEVGSIVAQGSLKSISAAKAKVVGTGVNVSGSVGRIKINGEKKWTITAPVAGRTASR